MTFRSYKRSFGPLASLVIPQARNLFIRAIPRGVAALFLLGVVLKAVTLLIECRTKKGVLTAPYSGYPSEALSNIINRGFQWWLNPLFVRGSRSVLSVDSLFPPDRTLSSKKLQAFFVRLWSQGKCKNASSTLRYPLM